MTHENKICVVAIVVVIFGCSLMLVSPKFVEDDFLYGRLDKKLEGYTIGTNEYWQEFIRLYEQHEYWWFLSFFSGLITTIIGPTFVLSFLRYTNGGELFGE